MKKVLYLIAIAGLGLAAYLYSKPGVLRGGAKAIETCEGCNVVVVLIDTMRADHLPFYGYSRDTAPFLSSMASKSVVFERAFATAPWTAPSTASLFTSLYPSQHGVVTGYAASKRLQRKQKGITMNRIPAKIQTLGEFMKSAGYPTIAVTDNINISKPMGFHRGFDYFENYRSRGAEAVNKKASEFLDKVKDQGPYFLYLHYMDPHSPYLERGDWFKQCLASTGGSEREKTVCAYDSEMRYLDSQISELFHRYSILENSIVFIVSDHGEEFWEHGRLGHSKTLYKEVLHIPFVFYHPRRHPARIAENVLITDVLPTLARLLSIEPSARWEGKDLVSFIDSPQRRNDRVLLSERLRHPAQEEPKWWKRSVIEDKWHYIRTEDLTGPLERELYDLEIDFAETANIYSESEKIGLEMEQEFENYPPLAWLPESESFDVELDAGTVDQLRTLGYLD
ncbi:MAG: sulfatase [Deltaproteobacteria bacterium]|nr:sulfatase [Deltaproteobacteria bacterium]